MKNKVATLMALALLAASMLAQSSPTAAGGEAAGGSSWPVQAAPDKVPLASPSALKAYALTLVGKISAGVNGKSVSGDYYRSVKYSGPGADPEGMAMVAGALSMIFSADPDDELVGYLTYESREITFTEPGGDKGSASFNLFWGVNEFKPENSDGKWKVPAEAKKFELELGQVPFAVPGMKDAHFVANYKSDYNFREQQGGYWLDRGIIFLDLTMTSRYEELVLVMKDGSKVIYDLSSGVRRPMVVVEAAGFDSKIKGVRTVPANTTGIVYQDTDEVIRVSFTEPSEVSVFFPAGLKRYPRIVGVISPSYLAEFPDAEWLEFNPVKQPVVFQCGEGALLIRFDY